MSDEWKPKEHFDNGRTVLWGKHLSRGTIAALDAGEIFTLLDQKGKPCSTILKDSFGTLRERTA